MELSLVYCTLRPKHTYRVSDKPILWGILLVSGIGIHTGSTPEKCKRTPVLPGGLVIKPGEGPGRPIRKNVRHNDNGDAHYGNKVMCPQFVLVYAV